MTFFQDDNGNVIEVNEDLQLYKSAVNLFDFTIKGNFSTSFQVPNNSKNKNSFQYFTPLQIPSNGFKATLFNLVKDGNILERGQLVLEREDYDYLHFFFISGNSNWITLIPDISIKDIDYENYASEYKTDNFYALRAATSGFCYPLVDWGILSKKNNNLFINYNLDTSQNYYKGALTEFYPCFFLKSAISEIFTHCQLKIGGDILDDVVYQQMIITPDNGQIERASKFYTERKVSVSNENDSRFYPGGTKINLDLTIENGALGCWDSATQKYTANKSHILNVTCSFNLSLCIQGVISIYKNGVFYKYAASFTGGPDGCSGILSFNEPGQSFGRRDAFVNVTTGDYIEIYVDFLGTNRGTFNCTGPIPSAPTGVIAGDYYTIGTPGEFGTAGSHVTTLTGDIVHQNVTNSQNASDWTLIPISVGISIAAGGILKIEPTQLISYGALGNADTIRASDIFPDIKMIDLIKFVSNYFCSIPTYDESTKTVTFNKLDNYDYSQAKDWSQYLQKLENNYQIQTAKYNYIRFKEIDDPSLRALGSNNSLKYGDVLIQGQSSQSLVKDLFQFTFGPAIDRFSYKYAFQTPFIPLVEIVPDGDPIKINSVTNGSPVALFNTATANNFIDGLILIYGTGEYDGYCVGEMFSNQFTPKESSVSYTRNATGYIQPLTFNFRTEQSRILFFTGEQNIQDFSSITSVNIMTASNTKSSMGYSYFSKPSSVYAVSSYKQGLNLDYYQGGYNDIPRRQEYYKNLTRILNAPYVKGWFLLPEDEFAGFNFDTFIFIKDKNQQRYYYVDSIENYSDSKELCQVNMLLLP